MNNAPSPITGHQPPAAARARLASGTAPLAGNFSEGVVDSFPMISFRGKVFRFRFQGEEKPHLDPQSGHPIPYLDVVLLNASKALSKTFYETGYTEGANTPPTCWSLDSIRPDPSVVAKQNPTCPDCRWNAFGSRITPAGKQAKACQDRRRIVVGLAAGFGQREVVPVMLNAPQSSLKPLREYVTFLQRNGFPPNACVTRLSFDFNEAYPKLTFSFVQPLTDQQYMIAEQMEDDERTRRILQSVPVGVDEDGEPGTLRSAAAPNPNSGYVQPPVVPQQAPNTAAPYPGPGPVAQAAAAPPPYQAPVTGAGYQPVQPPVHAPPPPPPAQAMPWENQPPPVVHSPTPPPPPQPVVQQQPIAAPAPAAVWQPPVAGGDWAPAQPVSAVPGPGWAAPQSAGPVQAPDDDVPEFVKRGQVPHAQPQEQQAEAAASTPEEEDKPAPKRRTKTSPAQVAETTAEAQAAPANMEKSLADLLGGL